MRKTLLLIVLLISCCTSFAQNFTGKVFENKTRVTLSNIWVENLRNKANTFSDKNGKFSIPAKVGDLVLFKGFAYQSDTVLVTDLNTKEIFLEPQQIQLNQVNITTTEVKKNFLPPDPQLQNRTAVYHRDRKGNLDGGVTFRLFYWKKPERDRAKLEKKLQDFAVMDRIREVFTPQVIGRYVPLKGDELDNFISLYTPTVKVFSANDFNLLDYLNLSFKKYKDLPPEKRTLAPLKAQ